MRRLLATFVLALCTYVGAYHYCATTCTVTGPVGGNGVTCTTVCILAIVAWVVWAARSRSTAGPGRSRKALDITVAVAPQDFFEHQE